MHLNTEDLVDIAEGARSEMSAPHLAVCEPCRSQLRDLRAMMAAAQEVDVPEPSPLFWDHLSSRVLEAVAAEPLPTSRIGLAGARALLAGMWRARTFQASAILALAFVILVFVNGSMRVPSSVAPVASIADADAAVDRLGDLAADDDASLTLVASLTDGQDLEVVREAGLAPGGTAEHAVAQMSDGELQELGRLLREELARPGA